MVTDRDFHENLEHDCVSIFIIFSPIKRDLSSTRSVGILELLLACGIMFAA